VVHETGLLARPTITQQGMGVLTFRRKNLRLLSHRDRRVAERARQKKDSPPKACETMVFHEVASFRTDFLRVSKSGRGLGILSVPREPSVAGERKRFLFLRSDEVDDARFYVPEPRIEEGRLRVEGREGKHIRRVLRLKPGDRVTSSTARAKNMRDDRRGRTSSVLINIHKIFSPQRDSHLDVTLAQSLLKGEKMDYVIQKATELGVKEIIPFHSSRSVLWWRSRSDWNVFVAGEDRHRGSKQCGRGMLPRSEFFRTILTCSHPPP